MYTLDYIITDNVSVGRNTLPLDGFMDNIKRHYDTANNIYARVTAATYDIDMHDYEVFDYIAESCAELYREFVAAVLVL